MKEMNRLAASTGVGIIRPSGLIIITILWALNSLLRILFGEMGATGTQLLDVEVSNSVMDIINIMCLILGAVGLVATVGFWRMKKWGLYGVLVIRFLTILFDAWGCSIQFTASMEFIVPTLAIVYMKHQWGNNLWR